MLYLPEENMFSNVGKFIVVTVASMLKKNTVLINILTITNSYIKFINTSIGYLIGWILDKRVRPLKKSHCGVLPHAYD